MWKGHARATDAAAAHLRACLGQYGGLAVLRAIMGHWFIGLLPGTTMVGVGMMLRVFLDPARLPQGWRGPP